MLKCDLKGAFAQKCVYCGVNRNIEGTECNDLGLRGIHLVHTHTKGGGEGGWGKLIAYVPY